MSISEQEYKELLAKIRTYHDKVLEVYGPKKDSFTFAEEVALGVPIPTNEDRSKVEVYEFIRDKPERYFLYIKEETNTATTWTGAILGSITLGKPYTTPAFGFPSKRRSVTIKAINGCTYYGTYFVSSGNYARVKKTIR